MCMLSYYIVCVQKSTIYGMKDHHNIAYSGLSQFHLVLTTPTRSLPVSQPYLPCRMLSLMDLLLLFLYLLSVLQMWTFCNILWTFCNTDNVHICNTDNISFNSSLKLKHLHDNLCTIHSMCMLSYQKSACTIYGMKDHHTTTHWFGPYSLSGLLL